MSSRVTACRRGLSTALPLTLGSQHLSNPTHPLSLPSLRPHLLPEVSPHSTVHQDRSLARKRLCPFRLGTVSLPAVQPVLKLIRPSSSPPDMLSHPLPPPRGPSASPLTSNSSVLVGFLVMTVSLSPPTHPPTHPHHPSHPSTLLLNLGSHLIWLKWRIPGSRPCSLADSPILPGEEEQERA